MYLAHAQHNFIFLNGNPYFEYRFWIARFFYGSFDLPTCILNPKLTKLELSIKKKKNLFIY